MSLANHLDELHRKHGDIEREIDNAMTHPSVDDLQIVDLKRRKLALKDEIEKLKAQPTAH
ncbi:YdcH family protein [Mesorhizobium sp. A623]